VAPAYRGLIHEARDLDDMLARLEED